MLGSTMSYQCKTCGKVFARQDILKRHVETVHIKGANLQCRICFKQYSRKDNLLRHLKYHATEARNGQNTVTTDVTRTVSTQKDIAPAQTPSTSVTGRDANGTYTSIQETSGKRIAESDDQVRSQSLKRMKTSEVSNSVSCEDLVEVPANVDEFVSTFHIPERTDCSHEDVLRLYKKHWNDIRTKFRRQNKLRDVYNYRLSKTSREKLIHHTDMIFDDQKYVFKINVGLGFFLRNVETCELRYYYASNNSKLFKEPFQITNKLTLEHFTEALLAQDLLEHARLQRPNSKWVIETVTNVTYFVYKVLDHPIGCVTVEVPDYVKDNKAIVNLEKNLHTGEPNNDNMCLFRCLALFRGSNPKSLEKETHRMYRLYSHGQDPRSFDGVRMKELTRFEDSFNVNIVVYELNKQETENGDSTAYLLVNSSILHVAQLVRRSLEKFKDTMYVNLIGNHFSYISDINMYSKTYMCRKCQKLWKESKALIRHETKCEGKGSKHKFPGGVFQLQRTVFEQLEDEGFAVPEKLRYHPYRAVFDFECYFESQVEGFRATDKLTWEAKHVPLSASVCSNVPGFLRPRCFISNEGPHDLIQNVVEYLSRIAENSQALLEETFGDLIRSVEDKIKQDQDEWYLIQDKYKSKGRPKQHHLKILLDSLTSWISEIPVLGFNSGSYDINLIKEFFFPYLIKNDPINCVIKRNNNYMCLRTDNLMFLDITNYLAPGFSYDAFLKAFECSQTKGFFPFEWFSLEKLDYPQLPPYETFYSDLKQSNISVEDYTVCKNVWKRENMKTMREFLVWYNNRDVEPFVEALEKMTEFYKERGIDAFKDGISVPGLTMKHLFKVSNNPTFQLINEQNKDLYYTFRESLVGGPSIIFNRHQEKGKTFIRNNPSHVCQKIVGYDANALYLWAIMQDMPTGSFTRRKSDNGFKLSRTRPISFEWLEWKAYVSDVKIRHAMNCSEKRIGLRRIPVDGYCAETNTVLQFHGCYYHGHNCHPTRGKSVNEKTGVPMKTLFENTREIRQYVIDQGYNYEEVWECQFREMKKHNQNLRHFLSTLYRPLEFKNKLTEDQIIRAIQDNQLFGFVECDIHVPDKLKPIFAEMCPIFKNTNISRENIGEHMKQFAEENKIMQKPRRSLIGSMFGNKILLATPLIKWYLQHGLIITRIYQVIEYTPQACFRTFGESVSNARRAGDRDPSKAIIADTMKLIGNSSYGKTITNRERHTNVKMADASSSSKMVNSPAFRDLNFIVDDCYEVELAKSSIKMDLPIQIGLFVYQYAKLRMLQFYYDCLCKFFDVSKWEYVEMDTDSAYISIAGNSLEEILKPNMNETFRAEKHLWFPRDDTEEKMFDKRTPGLFKVEWQGDGIVALSSKMYYCFGGVKGDKCSCKGVNKKRNSIDEKIYKEVLTTKQPKTGENKGFRVRDNHVYTYRLRKDAFTYFYPKRKVQEDGVTTTYLDI
ncbi:uncharacterized protein [Apostichopus japonicus]|uniref:uncharacterized protein n=1 Tax=Stichopus japonicus TaxID=307972 RepID=UPI003AB63CD8